MSFFNSLRDAFSFLTILPVGRRDGSMESIGRSAYLFPVVGVAVGGGGAGLALLLQDRLPELIVAALLLGLLLYLTGLHHADGLLDLGDGLMVRGDKERKLAVLKDRYRGVGSITLFVVVVLLTVLAYGAILANHAAWELFAIIVAAEVGAKLVLVTVAYLGKPSHPGTGAYIIEGIKPLPKYLFALAFSAAVLFAGLNLEALYLLGALALFSFYMVFMGNRHFGGVNGDLLGASHEMARVVALLTILVVG